MCAYPKIVSPQAVAWCIYVVMTALAGQRKIIFVSSN
jgi:hypothetical protein